MRHASRRSSRVLFVCATHRDRREIARLNGAGPEAFFFHDYATQELEELTGTNPPAHSSIADPHLEIERIVQWCRETAIDCVVSTDDYPGSTLASVVARRLGLIGVDPAVNLLCQHKYEARRAQRAIVPEATPEFALIAGRVNGSSVPSLRLPYFIKPVKGLFSVGAQRVDSEEHLAAAVRRATLPGRFFQVFEQLLQRYSCLEMSGYVLAETLLQGEQGTLEGYACRGEVNVLGIVDSIMFPDTLCFERFEYPSRLPAPVQARMARIAQRLMADLGYDNGFFNIEFMYDPRGDALAIIEINPRMASQFADLYEKVDGVNTYRFLLDVAQGQVPQLTPRAGKYKRAASCVLRSFRNMMTVRVPSPKQIAAVEADHPDIRVEVLARPGYKLSQELQDGGSYRYGIVNVGGRDDQDIRDRLQRCVASLPFVFAPP